MEEDIKILEEKIKMEEDIQVLKEMLKTRKKQKEIIECAGGYCGNCNPDIKALENAIQTIKAYKELEEENTQLKTITQEYNSYLQDSNCDTKIIIADSEYFANGYFKENFIPKSKVKEKIEELKNGTYDAKIILQQLLED